MSLLMKFPQLGLYVFHIHRNEAFWNIATTNKKKPLTLYAYMHIIIVIPTKGII